MAFTSEEVLAGLTAIIAEEVAVDAATVAADQTLLNDLDIDSLSRLTIATQAEDEFKVSIPDEEINKFVTVGDLANFITEAQR